MRKRRESMGEIHPKAAQDEGRKSRGIGVKGAK